MRKYGLGIAAMLFVIIAIKLLIGVPEYPEKVLDIVKHWFFAWLKGGFIAVVIIVVIFVINKQLTDETMMSRIGMIIMPVLIPTLTYLCFGYIFWLTIFGVIAGLIIGYYAYIIDDHLLEVWEIRHIVLPLFFGLGFGISSTVAALTENWQDEYMYVSDQSTCNELSLKRYTSHTSCSKKGGCTTTYTWDTYKTLYFFNRGEDYYTPQEGKDYVLGHGAFGKKDMVAHDYHRWIGGEKLTNTGDVVGSKWIYLVDTGLVYPLNAVYEVEENFFGQALKDGKRKRLEFNRKVELQNLPSESDVPGIFSMSFDFFKIMATNPDFSLLRWIYILIYIPFIVGAVFSPGLRIALFIFFISSTVIILIIIAIIAGKSGRSLEDFVPNFGGYGGGSFGGAGASGQW